MIYFKEIFNPDLIVLSTIYNNNNYNSDTNYNNNICHGNKYYSYRKKILIS